MQSGYLYLIASTMAIVVCLASLDARAQEPSAQDSEASTEEEPVEEESAGEGQEEGEDEEEVNGASPEMPPGAEDQDIMVLHTPLTQLPAGESLIVRASIDNDWMLDRIWVGLRRIGSDTPYREMELRRDASNFHSVMIPGELTQPPGLEYYLATQHKDSSITYHFGSPEEPHPVLFDGETAELRESQRLARHGGWRTAVSVSGDYLAFGSRLHFVESDGLGEERETDSFSENFWHLEVEYLYRQARTLYDIHFGIGLMRGSHGTINDGAQSLAPDQPGTNYGYGGATLELSPIFSLQGRLTFGASAKGFTMGAGGLLRIGQIGGTNLEVGYDFIGGVGDRTRVHFSWDTVPQVPMGLGIELTNWPDFEINPRGSRLYYEIGLNLNHAWLITTRVGYVTRANGITGGYTAGLQTVYQF